jgi:hypothetical protein
MRRGTQVNAISNSMSISIPKMEARSCLVQEQRRRKLGATLEKNGGKMQAVCSKNQFPKRSIESDGATCTRAA